MTGRPVYVNHDDFSGGEAIELNCGTVIDAPNRLTLGWLVAKHVYEEGSQDWSKLSTREKCLRLASMLDKLDKIDEEEVS